MRLSVKANLIGVLLGLTAALAITVAGGWMSLEFSRGAVRSIQHDGLVRLQQLKTTSDLYAVTIVDTAHKVRNGNLSWEHGLRTLEAASNEADRKWSSYLDGRL